MVIQIGGGEGEGVSRDNSDDFGPSNVGNIHVFQ